MSSTLPQQHDDHEAALGPPRFTLRALLAGMTVLCCVFGLMTALGSVWSMAILLFLCLILAHVLGNSMGTRLRDRASRRAAAQRSCDPRPTARINLDVTAPQRLTERARLNRITLVVGIGGGLTCGAIGGTLSAFIYPDAGAAAVGLGVVSSAVLGAFGGFAASSFLAVALAAVGEALREPAVHRLSQHPPQ